MQVATVPRRGSSIPSGRAILLSLFLSYASNIRIFL
nr:MAG TPA: hypothetical protein [Caudoviricetes sp.]